MKTDEFRNYVYHQSMKFMRKPPNEVEALMQIESVTDPLAKQTEESIKFQIIALKQAVLTGEEAKESEEAQQQRTQKSGIRVYWSSVGPSILASFCDHAGAGLSNTLPILLSISGGFPLLLGQIIVRLLVMVPVTSYELISGQIYGGTAPRVFSNRHKCMKGLAIVPLLILLVSLPMIFHNLGITASYLYHAFRSPLPWSMSREKYLECAATPTLRECESKFHCSYETSCVGNPFKFAEHFFNSTILGYPHETWPGPKKIFPDILQINSSLAIAVTAAFLVIWLLVDLGGRRVFEFLAIAGGSMEIFLLTIMLPISLSLEGALGGLNRSLIELKDWRWLWNPRYLLASVSMGLSGATLMKNVDFCVGSGFPRSHTKTRYLALIIHGLATCEVVMKCIMISALLGHMEPSYRSRMPGGGLQQGGGLPEINVLARRVSTRTTNYSGIFGISLVMNNLYGATEWSILFFAGSTLRAGVRLLLCLKALELWFVDAGFLRAKSRIASYVIPSIALGISLVFLLRKGYHDASLTAMHLTSSASQYAIPFLLAAVFLMEAWLLSGGWKKFENWGYVLAGSAIAVTISLNYREDLIKTPHGVGRMVALEYVTLVSILLYTLAPALIRSCKTTVKVTPGLLLKNLRFLAAREDQRLEVFRVGINIATGIVPVGSRLHKWLFSAPLTHIVPFAGVALFVGPLTMAYRVLQPGSWIGRNSVEKIHFWPLSGALVEFPLTIYMALWSLFIIVPFGILGIVQRRDWFGKRKHDPLVDLISHKDPGPRFAMRRLPFRFWEEFLPTSIIWKRSEKVTLSRRF